MSYTDPQFWPQLKQLAVTIDGLDYFQVLNLTPAASPQEIKASYYNLARALHPDAFYTLPDEELKLAVGKIYRRVTEAYTILKDEPKRKKYAEDVSGPERMQKLRYNEQAEQEQKEKEREAREVAKTPQGKKMLAAAVLDYQAGRLDKAIKNLQSAMLFEMGNAALKQMKDEWEAQKKAQK